MVVICTPFAKCELVKIAAYNSWNAIRMSNKFTELCQDVQFSRYKWSVILFILQNRDIQCYNVI